MSNLFKNIYIIFIHISPILKITIFKNQPIQNWEFAFKFYSRNPFKTELDETKVHLKIDIAFILYMKSLYKLIGPKL